MEKKPVMNEISIIMLSNAKNEKLKSVTENAIRSCLDSSKDMIFDIIIFEKNPYIFYKSTRTFHYNFDFNYNKLMNLGVQHSLYQYVGMFNNDVLFHSHWAENVLREMQQHELLSASCFCPHFNNVLLDELSFGYELWQQVNGWALVVNKKIFSKIKKIPEDVTFWYSDNCYAELIKYHKIKHALVKKSVVEHLEQGSGTIRNEKKRTKDKFTKKQHDNFLKFKETLWGKGEPD